MVNKVRNFFINLLGKKVHFVKLQLYEKVAPKDKVALELMLETCKRRLKEKERFGENLEAML